jgi:hypothetical protein
MSTIFTYSDNSTTSSTDTVLRSNSYSPSLPLKSVVIGPTVTELFAQCFMNAALTSVTLNSNVSKLGDFAFAGCLNLTSVTITPSVTYIGTACFASCSNLTNVIFDNQSVITYYGPSCFAGNGSLQHVTYYSTASIADLTSTSLAAQSSFTNNATPNFFIYIAAASCFNKGSKILCLNKNLQDEWVSIEQLRPGDIVKTYLHGYRRIELIGKGQGKNIEKGSLRNLYKLKKAIDGFEPLQVTGWHSVLVDDMGERGQENTNLLAPFGILQIDGKHLLVAGMSADFEETELGAEFTYYHFVLESDGDEKKRFGVWANGVLTETTDKKDFVNHHYKDV